MISNEVQVNLKRYFDDRIKAIAEYSDTLSNQYQSSREEFGKKLQDIGLIKIQIKNTLHIFNEALKVCPELRLQISNVKGMSTQEIIQKKAQLQSLYSLYDKFQIYPSQLERDVKPQSPKIQTSQTLDNMHDTEPLQKLTKGKGGLFGRTLQFYEGLCCILGLFVFLLIIYKQFF